ncbi:MAG TPA: EcsC family protein [Pirellulales bacterium]|nr:EcsC family protein [Pirellulales bacterium]
MESNEKSDGREPGPDFSDESNIPAPADPTTIQKLEQKADELVRWLTDQAILGVPPLSSAADLADEYKIHQGYGSDDERVEALIKWECSKNFASGFVTGLGGIITTPVSLPAALGASWIIQARMAAAIARIYGHNLDDNQVRAFVLLTLLGNEAAELLRQVGIKAGTRLTLEAIKKIPGKTITAINQLVGFRLLTKAGQKGIVNLTKLVPVAGGIVGGTFDLVACQTVGRIAKKIFQPAPTR